MLSRDAGIPVQLNGGGVISRDGVFLSVTLCQLLHSYRIPRGPQLRATAEGHCWEPQQANTLLRFTARECPPDYPENETCCCPRPRCPAWWTNSSPNKWVLVERILHWSTFVLHLFRSIIECFIFHLYLNVSFSSASSRFIPVARQHDVTWKRGATSSSKVGNHTAGNWLRWCLFFHFSFDYCHQMAPELLFPEV